MIRIFAIFFLLFLTTMPQAHGETNRREPLSVVNCEYMPFYFKGGNGELRGIFIDLWKLWSEKTGIPVEFRIHSWEEAVRQVKDGEADINAAVFHTPERDAYLDFSIPFFNVTSHLFHHVGVPAPKHLNQLPGYRIGAVTGDFSVDFLKNRPHSALTEYISHERLVTEAIAGNVDAFVMEGPVASTYLAKHDGLQRIRRAAVPAYTQHFRAAVREGDTALLRIIDRGMAAITPKEIDTIVRSWTGEPYPDPADRYPEKVVVAASFDQMPFHFVDEEGRVAGMFIDLWRLWGRVTGTEISFKTGTWSESLEMVRNGSADIHAGCFSQKGLRHEYRHHPAAPLYRNTYFAAVKKGDEILFSAVNEGFKTITVEERAAIERKWMGVFDYKTKDVLMFSFDKAYPPFSMLDSEGNASGMVIDIWRLWAQKTGRTSGLISTRLARACPSWNSTEL
jgi:ABC-type amino acid transport substrate-binding protein